MFICFIITLKDGHTLHVIPTSAVSQRNPSGGVAELPVVTEICRRLASETSINVEGNVATVVGAMSRMAGPAKNRTPFDRSLMKTSIFWKMLKRIPAFFWGEFFTYCVLVFFREKPKTGYKFIEFSADFLGERSIRVRGADVEQRVMSGIYDILLV